MLASSYLARIRYILTFQVLRLGHHLIVLAIIDLQNQELQGDQKIVQTVGSCLLVSRQISSELVSYSTCQWQLQTAVATEMRPRLGTLDLILA